MFKPTCNVLEAITTRLFFSTFFLTLRCPSSVLVACLILRTFRVSLFILVASPRECQRQKCFDDCVPWRLFLYFCRGVEQQAGRGCCPRDTKGDETSPAIFTSLRRVGNEKSSGKSLLSHSILFSFFAVIGDQEFHQARHILQIVTEKFKIVFLYNCSSGVEWKVGQRNDSYII